MGVRKILSPDIWLDNVKGLHVEYLIKRGIDVFVFDFDNTLAPWRSCEISDDVKRFLKSIQDRGGIVIIASNGKPRNIEMNGAVFLWRTGKPLAVKLRRYLSQKSIDRNRIIIVGDQIFTDVLTGKFLKVLTAKVKPISTKEFFGTRFLRLIEKVIEPTLKKEEAEK